MALTKSKDTTHPSSKVRKSSSKGRRRLEGIQTGRANLTEHLNRRKAETSGEAGSLANERGAKRESAVRGGLEGDVDDHGEVLGHEEGRNVLLDEVEALLEPGGGRSETRKDVELPARRAESVGALIAQGVAMLTSRGAKQRSSMPTAQREGERREGVRGRCAS